MSTFNECHIHLCDCTWLNVFSHAQYLLIKYKKIFECLSCFWKVFCFCKNVKNFKNSIALFWWLSCGLVQSYVPVASPHRDFSRLTGGSLPQSWKILRIFFKIWFFNVFRNSIWQLIRRWKVQLLGVHRDFCGSDRDSLVSGTSSREKHLENFSKIFLSSVLVASLGDFLATWLSHEKCVFSVLWSIF